MRKGVRAEPPAKSNTPWGDLWHSTPDRVVAKKEYWTTKSTKEG